MKKCRIVLLLLREMKITVIRFSTAKPHRTSHTVCSRCNQSAGWLYYLQTPLTSVRKRLPKVFLQLFLIKVMFWTVFLEKLSVFKMVHGYRPMSYRHSPQNLNSLSWIPRTYMVERETLLKIVFRSPHTCCNIPLQQVCARTQTYTQEVRSGG